MGFAPNEVGRALVSTRGNASKALEILTSTPTDDSAEDEADLARALQMSLEPVLPADMTPAETAVPTTSASTRPLWDPPRYVPSDGSDALRVVGGKTLSLVEDVQIRDAGYSWQRATAFLDTGNQHITIVDTKFAKRHAIYAPDSAAAFMPFGTSFGQAERFTTLHGVVPGASSRVPCVTIALKIRGEEFVIQAAVSDMGSGHDLLLGVDVLRRLFESGYQIGAGSM